MGVKEFSEGRIFEYNKAGKIMFGVMVIIGAVILASVIASYFLVIKHSDWIVFVLFRAVGSHMMNNIKAPTFLGVIYTSLIGGLFFIFVPVELFLAGFFKAGLNAPAVGIIYALGITVSYTINYFIGARFSSLSKRLISPKKFYSTKGNLNRYGGLLVYVFNAIPLPSQQLAAILGVFKYNKTRFYFYVMLGQLTKMAWIFLSVKYIF